MIYYIIGIVALLVFVGIAVFFVFKRKKSKIDKDYVRGNIQLVSVLRLKGSNKITGLETDKEVQDRLSKLTQKEFLALNVIAYPYTKKQWQDSDENELYARNLIEQQMLFAYNGDKKLNSVKAKFIRRFFE